MWQQIYQILGVVTVIFMDMVQKIIHPLLEVHVCCLAASHQGVDDGSIFSSVVIAAEEIVLASDSYGSHTVLYQVRVWEIPSVHRIPHQPARVVQEVADGFSYGTLRKHISLLTDTPLLKSAYDGIGKPLPQLHALEGIHMLVVCHALHIIKHADLGQSVFRPRLVMG